MGEALTRPDNLLLLIDPGLVPPRPLAQGLVAGADGHDGQQGEDQRRCAAHVPLAEDDAEVRGVPGEEHLSSVVDGRRRGPVIISWPTSRY